MPEKLDRCVQEVMAKDERDVSSEEKRSRAFAICQSQIGDSGGSPFATRDKTGSMEARNFDPKNGVAVSGGPTNISELYSPEEDGSR